MREQLSSEATELAKKASNGDLESFSALYKNCYTLTVKWCLRLNLRHDEAEDLSQGVWITIFKNLKDFDSAQGTFEVWLYTITRNRTIDYIRRKKKAKNIIECDVLENVFFPPSIKPAQLQMFDEIRIKEIVALVPEADFQIFKMRFLMEKDYSEIASLLNLPLGSVKSRIFRLRTELRSRLKRMKINISL